MSLKLKNLAAGLLFTCVLAILGSFDSMTALAANTRIAFSDLSVIVGNEVTVTVKVSSDTSLGKATVMLAYDPDALDFISGTDANGDAGAIKLQSSSDSVNQKALGFSLKFKAKKAGDTKITVMSQEIYDGESNLLTVDKTGSSTIKVTSPATYSKNATLKSLKISPGELNPEFSPSVESYTASVDGNTTDLVVNAVAANAGANVTLNGDKGLKTGENKVVVTVKAEDGTTVKNYTILVSKAEGGSQPTGDGQTGDSAQAAASDVTAIINNKMYKVAVSFDASKLPEGFEPETYDLKGTSVMAGKGLEKDLTLFYLIDQDGNGSFYIYNAKADSWSPFAELQISSKAIVILPLDDEAAVPKGFVKRVIQVSKTDVTGWIPESESVKGIEPVHCLFYGMNWNGDKGFYLYDKSESTIQKYFVNEAGFDTSNVQLYLLIGVSVLAVLLLIALIVLLLKGRGGNGGGGRRSHEDEELRESENREAPILQEERTSRVRQYSRDEFEAAEQEALDPVEEPKGGDQEDRQEVADFEDFEKKLSTRLASEVKLTEMLRRVEMEEREWAEKHGKPSDHPVEETDEEELPSHTIMDKNLTEQASKSKSPAKSDEERTEDEFELMDLD